ncbi:MAG: hypothetical protein KGZ40_04945 [Clostridiales bacterium]|nr:hypothetical protein [Clostridiales bacterium]
MNGRLRRIFTVALAAITLTTTVACGLDGGHLLSAGVIYPSITPDMTAAGTRAVSHTFRFEGRERTISVAVAESLYQGARSSTKSAVRFGGSGSGEWIDEYYPAFIWDTEQDPFFSDLLAPLRDIRTSETLDLDRYAELLVAFVQSFEYRTGPDELEPKFPVETFADRSGDCDDKALLLAGLLAREGYDVAIMLFEPEQHVAVGVRTKGPCYRGTGYAFIETTSPGYIGMVPSELDGGITLESAPRVIPIGEGTVAYESGHEVAAILALLANADERITELRDAVSRADTEIAAARSHVDAEQARLESLRAGGRLDEHDAGVSAYNSLVSEFNASVETRNAIANDFNRWVEIQALIVDSAHDRPAAYRAARSF